MTFSRKLLAILALFYLGTSSILLAQNVGIGLSNPASKMSVKGNFALGNNFAAIAAPTNGAIIEGQTVIGRSTPLYIDDLFTAYSNTGQFSVCGYVYNGIPSTTSTPAAINSGAVYGYITGAGGLGLLIDHFATRDHGAIINTYGTSAITALKGDSESNSAHGVMGENPSAGSGYAVYANGDLYYAGGIYNASDKNLKQNIKTYSNGLATIMALNPKTYIYKPELVEKYRLQSTEQVGFLAQELEAVMPNLVREGRLTSIATASKDADKNVTEETITAKTVNYTALIPVMTAAIQEQQLQINTQAKQIEQQAQQIKLLEEQNNLIKEQLQILINKDK